FKLQDDETIAVEVVRSDGDYRKIVVYAVAGKQKRVLNEIQKGNRHKLVIKQESKVFYTKLDPKINHGYSEVWIYDAETGKEEYLGCDTASTFCISSDGNYICLVHNIESKETNWGIVYRPAIIVRHLESEAEEFFDFSDSFLENQWGVSVNCKYIGPINAFYIEFSQDAPGNIGKGYIHLDSMKFELLEE
ncbi:hypothetical protein, partial [Marispirochaeta sp.]|uniref:hypothetical protein n=1 Tax=Marispirochaeta sp. TaxID=2038653 RepID=UPI0029C7C7A7